MNITAKELSGNHIGKTMTLTFQQGTYTAKLLEVRHQANVETLYGLVNSEIRSVTHQWVYLTIGSATFPEIPYNTPITIQEGQ